MEPMSAAELDLYRRQAEKLLDYPNGDVRLAAQTIVDLLDGVESLRLAYIQSIATLERCVEENTLHSKEERRVKRMTHLCETSLQELDRLRAQVVELLQWARAGATRGRTDSTWDAAEELLRRIDAGEFGS
jgi:hypothetical protein